MSQHCSEALSVVIQSSRLGWFAVAGTADAVTYLTFGHASPTDLFERLEQDGMPSESRTPSITVTDAADAIRRYLDGEPVDLLQIPVAMEGRTPFQQRVVQALRRVSYGATVSYAALAEQAGAPRAARAVGTVMSTNRIPLLIPCHRVVGSGGKLGGFSAPQGINMKRALLAMEAGEVLADDLLRHFDDSLQHSGDDALEVSALAAMH